MIQDHNWARNEALDYIAGVSDVSRETIAGISVIDALDRYSQILTKWQAKINLVSGKTLDMLWTRHILDSAQLVAYLPDAPRRIMDIGSGAGLPGLILAIITQHAVHLVESDQRKCAFLRAAAKEVGVDVIIHNDRIETLPDLGADFITARALAPLDKLLDLTHKHHHDGQQFLFLKGKTAKQELTMLASWPKLNAVLHPSITDSEATLIHLSSDA